MEKETRKRIINHSVYWMLILVSLLFSVFRFAPVFIRMMQSLQDLAFSLARYFLYFDGKESLLPATVTQIPEGMDTLLPYTFEEYKILWDEFWELFANEANFVIWLYVCRYHFARFARTIIILLFPTFTLLLVWYLTTKRVNLKKNDSWPLTIWKKLRRIIYIRVKTFVVQFVEFYKSKKLYRVLFWLVWLYNFNILTIGLEAVAFIFHFAISFDLKNILVQIAKFAMDISVPVQFLPWWATAAFCIYIFHRMRCAWAKNRLKNYVKKTEEFLERYPGAMFIVGKQRKKKTSFLTMLKRVCERVFRQKAQDKLLEREKQFPHFRWADIDDVVQECRENGRFTVFEDIEKFVNYLAKTCEEWDLDENQTKRRIEYLKEEYSYDVQMLMDYVKDNYPLTYNNGIVNVSIFTAIMRYAQLLFIYGQKTPLDASNYSIREDFTFEDYGCFPIYDGDFFRPVEESEEYTQFSHIIRYDAFRLGEVFDKDTRDEVAIEYGIGVCAEFAKERKNKVSRAGLKSSDKAANQNNDLFELDTKMRGHVATIDNYDFWHWFFDDQREDALGADNKDMTTVARIKKTDDEKVVLPFFIYDEILYKLVFKLKDKLKLFVKNRKKGKKLVDYILDVIFAPLFKHYDRMRNKYSIYRLTLHIEDGCDNEVLSDKEYAYIVKAVAYNDTFATDSHRTFYKRKHRKADVNLHNLKQYTGLYPTKEEYEYQQSYLVEDLNYAFGDKKKREKKSKKEEQVNK